MNLTQWNSTLVVGIDEMDEDHQRLVALLNQCFSALMLNNHNHELAAIVNELRDYAQYHFTTERKLMEDAQYPDLAAHLAAHEQFTESIRDFRERFMAGESFIAVDILNFLKQWLVAHIQQTDRKFAAFLKATTRPD